MMGTPLVNLQALQHVGMVAEDERRPGLGHEVGLLHLGRRGDKQPLLAPVQRHDDVVDFAAEAADAVGHAPGVEPGDAPLVGLREAAGAAALVGGAQEGQAQAGGLDKGGGFGLLGRLARPEVGDAHLVQQRPEVAEPLEAGSRTCGCWPATPP